MKIGFEHQTIGTFSATLVIIEREEKGVYEISFSCHIETKERKRRREVFLNG